MFKAPVQETNKIYLGPYDEYTFEPANKAKPYKVDPVSIFDYDPVEVGVESLSLNEKVRGNVRKNPVVVEGFGKVDHYAKRGKHGHEVDNSNRVVPGQPDQIKATNADGSNSIMTPEDMLKYQQTLSCNGAYNTPVQIVKNGKPVVWQAPPACNPTPATSAVNNLITGVKGACDNIRAPQDWKSFQRNDEEKKNLAFSAVPFESWSVGKIQAKQPSSIKFDPSAPYRPAQIDFSGVLPAGAQPTTNITSYKTFNRAAKPFGPQQS